MTKTIMILAIAVAFVVGSVMTGTMAYATGDKNGKPFEALWDAIHALETAVSLDDDVDSSNEDQTLSGNGEVVLGTTAAGDGGGTVTCVDITGGAGLCDGVDDVDDADNDSTNELQNWSNLPGIPAGFSDGVDNVNDADSSTTNELQGLVITYREGPPRTIPGSSTGSAFATCNADEKILGGGYSSGCGSLHPSDEEFAPQGTFPPAVLNSDAWLIFFKNNCLVDVDVTVTAICGKLSP